MRNSINAVLTSFCSASGDIDKAITLSNKCIKVIADHSSQCHVVLGTIYSVEKLGKVNFSQAVSHFKKAYELDSTDHGIIAGLGLVSFYAKDFSQAKIFLNKCIELKGVDPSVLKLKNSCSDKLGMIKKETMFTINL